MSLLKVLDSSPEPIFDHAVSVARQLMETPTALVSLIDAERQWFKAREGFGSSETSRSLSLCTFTIMSGAPLVIPDTYANPVFAKHPAVAGERAVRFYVGAPIVLSSGFRVGGLCVFDYAPRATPPEEAVQALQDLAAIVASALETRIATVADAADPEPSPADVARAEFLSLISHELRTPLNGVVGLAGVLASRPQEPEARKLIEALVQSGESLRRIVEHILHFSDAATGDLQLSEATVGTRELVDRVVAQNAPAAELAGKMLRVAEPVTPERVVIDPVQFEVALTCVVSNAIIHGGRSIEIGCWSTDRGEPVFSIWDDGRRMGDQPLTAMFEPFRIGQDVMRRTAGGIGMGLPLSKRLVELHGGELTLRRAEGQTVAAIRLPAYRSRNGSAA